MIVVSITIILAAVALVLLNPASQLASARNTRRTADVSAIANAVGQNSADNRGVFTCAAGALPAAATRMSTGTGNYNIAPCLVPAYLSTFPYDPSASGARYASNADYDSAYTIMASTTTGIITVAAPFAELGAAISVSR
ncbi:MAG: hypothetical protein HYZ07_01625 [Candidatus Harrisonbacteria bacterium]|nr:hypothetical protein [Candidatus Harrisonbacteria bacterium]